MGIDAMRNTRCPQALHRLCLERAPMLLPGILERNARSLRPDFTHRLSFVAQLHATYTTRVVVPNITVLGILQIYSNLAVRVLARASMAICHGFIFARAFTCSAHPKIRREVRPRNKTRDLLPHLRWKLRVPPNVRVRGRYLHAAHKAARTLGIPWRRTEAWR